MEVGWLPAVDELPQAAAESRVARVRAARPAVRMVASLTGRPRYLFVTYW